MNETKLRRRTRGYTLLEMQTILIILSVLLALFVPRFWRARDKASFAGCGENLKNLATALQVYANDNGTLYPTSLSSLTPNWISIIPKCPAAGVETYSASYVKVDSPPNYTMWCTGTWHGSLSYPPNTPYYYFSSGLGP